MVAVAQLAERLAVAEKVGGSRPLGHQTKQKIRNRGFFV